MGEKLATAGDYIRSRRSQLAITKGLTARLAGVSDGQWRGIEDGQRPADDVPRR